MMFRVSAMVAQPQGRESPASHPRTVPPARRLYGAQGYLQKHSTPTAAFAIFASVDQTDRANCINVVSAEFDRMLPQCGRAHEPEESLRSGQEIVALPQNQIKVLPRDRQKVQARCQRNGAWGDAAVGAVRAHGLRDSHPGRASRL